MTKAAVLFDELKATPPDKSLLPGEPALNTGIKATATMGALWLVGHFFPQLNRDIVDNILILIFFCVPIVTGLLTRGKVWSPASVKAVVQEGITQAQQEKEELARQRYQGLVIKPGDPTFKKPEDK